MDLDPVEASRHGVGSRLTKIVDDAGELLQRQCPGHRHLDEVIVDEGLGLGPKGRGGHRRHPIGLQRDVGDAADVPQLHEDPASPGMHRIGHLAPPRNLRRRVEAGSVLVALRLGRDLGRLGDQQTRRGPLAVIGGGMLARDQAGAGTVAGERRHHDAVGEGDGAKGIGLEESLVCHGVPLSCGTWVWEGR
ncbi:hypothetical protein D3C79_712230 [compost metagenome]